MDCVSENGGYEAVSGYGSWDFVVNKFDLIV